MTRIPLPPDLEKRIAAVRLRDDDPWLCMDDDDRDDYHACGDGAYRNRKGNWMGDAFMFAEGRADIADRARLRYWAEHMPTPETCPHKRQAVVDDHGRLTDKICLDCGKVLGPAIDFFFGDDQPTPEEE